MNKQEKNKMGFIPRTLQGWVLILLVLAFTGTFLYGVKSINKIQNDITELKAYADTTLRDSTTFMQPLDIVRMVNESTGKAFDTYVSTQGNLLNIVMVLITVIVIVIPMILNNNFRTSNEIWYKMKVVDAKNKMNENLQKSLDTLNEKSLEGVKAVEEQMNRQKRDIEGHQRKIDEQALTVARQAEEIRTLKENIGKITANYKLEVEHEDSLKQVDKKDSRKEKIEYLEAEINKNKHNYPASGYYELGKLYFEEGEYAKAINKFEMAIEKNPVYIEAYLALTQVYRKDGDYENAWQTIETALGIKPNSSLLEIRGQLFIDMGFWEDALKDITRGLAMANDEGETHCKLRLDELEKHVVHVLQNQDDRPNNLEINVENEKIRMIKVDGGSFSMGASDDDQDAYSDEKPSHRVLLKDYYIGETTVTQALWKLIMDNNPSYFKGDDLPVEQVSWEDCQKFILKLNNITNLSFRLPTEAEWEYAARGGSKSKGFKYSGSDDINIVSWNGENSEGKTHPVKTKKANELGLFDMSGNVWEWNQDWFGEYSNNPQANPTGPVSGRIRIIRGGAWRSRTMNCRVSTRDDNVPDYRDNYLGFRLALDAMS